MQLDATATAIQLVYDGQQQLQLQQQFNDLLEYDADELDQLMV